MAKKRKSSARQTDESSGPNMDVGESRKHIRDFQDVADSDDEFHLNQDKILLDEEPEAKRRRKWQEQEEFLQLSDEEVIGYSEPEEDQDMGEDAPDGIASVFGDSHVGGEEEERELGWGTTRDDMYGADEIETEEQALEEEAEALRLQKKQLQSMTAADYGFDEAGWQRDDDAEEEVAMQHRENVVTEVLPELKIDEKAGPAERLKLLKSRYPEFDPLKEQFLSLKGLLSALIRDAEPQDDQVTVDLLPNAVTKLRAASAYLGALTMYFALLSSSASNGEADTVATSATHLHDHPVMESLVKCGELWARAKRLPVDPKPIREKQALPVSHSNGSLSGEGNAVAKRATLEPIARKSRAERHAEAAQAAAEARRLDRIQRTEADLTGLDDLIAPSTVKRAVKSKRTSTQENDAGSDLGEEIALTGRNAEEKAKRKKSLRFYTSQIAQRANKRGTAGRNAGGDDDIPHRERLRDRQTRLNAEAEKRGRRPTHPSAELNGESDEEDRRQAQEIRASGEGEDYYDVVAARTAQKKANKSAYVQAQKQAELQGGQVIEEEMVGLDGKRKITYAIEKNKGLTPHRKKEVRNPRVKKRKKFDEKKKKLASIKPVYKGGPGAGGYGGELTGIKKGLVKSTKL